MKAITDWEHEYNNVASVDNIQSFLDIWPELATKFRQTHMSEIDIPYGDKPRNKLDIFMPQVQVKGLFIFVHGGYWVRFDKSFWSNLAAGPLAKDWAVAMPSYTLCPEAKISEITQEITSAINLAAEKIDGPIVLVGHSAGGHLVTRQICEDSNLTSETLSRIKRVISISGVHDLRPIQRISHNEKIQLDDAEAKAESPALLAPLNAIPVTCVVGANELPEFIRQNDLLANIWRGLGVETSIHHLEGKNHFNVIDDLENPDGLIASFLS